MAGSWDLVAADDPTDWKAGFGFLRALDATLRCELCYDIFTAPVAIKECSHTFCSACIRSAINKPGEEMGSRCPRCMNKNVYDSSLVPQPTLEQAAQQWRLARPQLYAKQNEEVERSKAGPSKIGTKRARTASDSHYHDGDRQSESNGLRRSSRSTAKRLHSIVVDDSSEIDTTLDDDSNESEADEEAGSDDHTAAIANGSSSKDYRKMGANDLQACPICKHRFTMRMLNVHLDKMTCAEGDPPPSNQARGLPSSGAIRDASSNRSFAGSSSQGSAFFLSKSGVQSATPRKKLVRLNYDMVKPVDLKRALDEWRLSTSGERKRLIERHRRWINIFNANLDASEKMRKSDNTLRQELQAWERAQDEILRNSAASSVSEKRAKTWTIDHKDEFARLAAQARQSHIKDRSKHEAEAEGSESLRSE